METNNTSVFFLKDENGTPMAFPEGTTYDEIVETAEVYCQEPFYNRRMEICRKDLNGKVIARVIVKDSETGTTELIEL